MQSQPVIPLAGTCLMSERGPSSVCFQVLLFFASHLVWWQHVIIYSTYPV